MAALRTLLPAFAFLCLAGFLLAAQQQPPAASVPAGITAPPGGARATGVQQIDPPLPAQGQGVDLTVRIVDASTGGGMSGVAVVLRRNPNPQNLALDLNVPAAQLRGQPQSVDNRRWSYMATTDTKGSATVTNMMADAYTVVPSVADYVLANGSPNSITLSPGKNPPPVSLRMWRVFTVEGTVVDPDKNPISAATVELLTEGWVGGLRTMALAQPAINTGPDGSFSFPSVPPGTYYMRVKAPQALVQQQMKATADHPAALVDTMYPGVPFIEQAAQISVRDVNLFGLRVEMQFSKYFTLTGRVFGIPPEIKSSGLVLMRRVSLDSPFPFLAADPYNGAFSTRLMPDGSFVSPPLPPGPYWAGYTPAGPVRGGNQFLIVDRNVENFSAEVVQGLTLAGRAIYEDGSAVETGRSASLSIFVPNVGVYVRSFAIGQNGEFSASGLPAGSYRMDFSDGRVIKKAELNSRIYPGGDFDLASNLPAPAIVTLSRKGGGIQGNVELLERVKSYPRGLVTIAKQPFRPTDTVKRIYLNGTPAFNAEHLEAGHYRVCAWLEEGTDVDRVLGNPEYEKRLAIGCNSVEIAGDEATEILLKQLTSADFK